MSIDDDISDPWYDEEGLYDLIGRDEWEDQEGMRLLKEKLAIPDDWYLLKVTNFYLPGRTLDDIFKWLAENCSSEYRRVGWSSDCSTKVGVAFASAIDAFSFRITWS